MHAPQTNKTHASGAFMTNHSYILVITTHHPFYRHILDNGRMSVLLSPATGAGITAQTGTPAHPVTSAIAAGASPRGAQPVTSWGAFHFSAPTAEQLQDPTFIPRITRADRVSAANLPAYVREVERQAADSAQARFPATLTHCFCAAGCGCICAMICVWCSEFWRLPLRIRAVLWSTARC